MFQQVISTLGQTDGQYQLKTKILAVVKQVKKVEFSKSSGKPKQSLYLTDESGEDSWVTIIGTFDALDDTSLGKQYEFLVWPYKAEQSPKTTLYCWINRQVPVQSYTQPPQGSPQAPPQPPQRPIAAIATLPPEDYRALSLEIAGRLVAAGKYEYSAMFLEADIYAEYIKTGTHPFGLAGAVPGTTDGSRMDEEWPEPGSQG